MKTFEQHWEKVEEYLNWDRINKTMIFLDWSWVNKGVPDIDQLKATVMKLMGEAYNSETDYKIGTGGFKIEYFKEDDCFNVSFQLTNWSTY